MRANQRQRAATRLILTRSTKEKACATARADNKAFTGASNGVVIGRKESNKSGQHWAEFFSTFLISLVVGTPFVMMHTGLIASGAVFMTLSGFVLATAEARRPSKSTVQEYVLSRMVTIYPLYAAGLVVAFGMAVQQGYAPPWFVPQQTEELAQRLILSI
mgnify:CR=1 FL=1